MRLRFCIIAIIILQGYATLSQHAKLQASLQKSLDSLRNTTQVPGISFSCMLPDNTVMHVYSGFADEGTKELLASDSRMLAGSTGKTFFAALTFLAVQENKIGLDDKIEKYLNDKAWFSSLPNYNTITIRMLMNHTSGLEEYYELGDNMDKLINEPDKHWHAEEQIAQVLNRQPLFESGKGWDYADTNYLVLGLILEKVFAKPLFEEIRERFIIPNELVLTEAQDKPIFKNLVNGYTGDRNPFRIQGAVLHQGRHKINPQMEGAGGGFISNSRDLARWGKIYYTASFVSEKLKNEIRSGVPAKTGKDHQYGLGMQIRPSPFGTGYGHSGWFPGYTTDMEYFPEHNLSVAIQLNTDDFERTGFKSARYFMLTMMKKVIDYNNQ